MKLINFLLTHLKNQLLRNIELRTTSMIKNNCVSEVIRFKKRNFKKSLSPHKIIGSRNSKIFERRIGSKKSCRANKYQNETIR